MEDKLKERLLKEIIDIIIKKQSITEREKLLIDIWNKIGINEERIKLARQCLDFKSITCNNEDCKNYVCPLNKLNSHTN